MSEEYNPQAQLMEEIERLEVEIKQVIHKRDQAHDPKEKGLLQQELEELQAQLRHLQSRLV